MNRREPRRIVPVDREAVAARGETFAGAPYGGDLSGAPPVERWENWVEPDPRGGGLRATVLVPTACEGCGTGCGLLASVDQDSHEVLRVSGNPLHTASRGRICTIGNAAVDQIDDPDRILHPLRRVGPRGEGRWEKCSWDDALKEIAERTREAISGERLAEILVHLGRPEPDSFTTRTLAAWGLDALCYDTTAGQPAGGLGSQLWLGSDSLGMDLEHASLVVIVGSPRDGSPMLPDPARLAAARRRGARVVVIDPVRSSLANQADLWLAPHPGSEAALLLTVCNVLIQERAFNRDFMRRWWNWQEYMEARYPGVTVIFPRFELALQRLYAHYTVEYAERECGVPAANIQRLLRWVTEAGAHVTTWCGGSATEGSLGGWQIPRAALLLCALVGSIGGEGGVSPGSWWRFLPQARHAPHAPDLWNELAWPSEHPMAGGPASPLLPHLLRQGPGKLSVYLSVRFNPLVNNPDGFGWLDLLRDEACLAFHAALTPVWTETARYADLVLPVGTNAESHGLVSAPTHDARWLALKQPAVRVAKNVLGVPLDDTRRGAPAQVWEEELFWIALSWHIDPDGAWGIRDHFESRQFRGERLSLDEHYSQILEHGVPELAEAAVVEGQSALQYLRQRGFFLIDKRVGPRHERVIAKDSLENVRDHGGRTYAMPPREEEYKNAAPQGQPKADGRGRVPVGVRAEGELREGFPTPSGRLEFYSTTLAEWGWPEHTLPGYIKSHAHRDALQRDELVWVPIFEPPVAEGSRWTAARAQGNPLWIHPTDAKRLEITRGAAVRIETEIGHFVTRAWLTEAVRPGVVASHPFRGRWRLLSQPDHQQQHSMAAVSLHSEGERRSLAREDGVHPFPSENPDSDRIDWSEVGVPCGLALPVQPDPISGAHCWHLAVRVRPAQGGDVPGDVSADLERSRRVVVRWLQQARRADEVSPDRTRRPRWLIRPLQPTPEASHLQSKSDA